MMNYLDLFTREGVTSFSTIPIDLPKPQAGDTWTVNWLVKDQALVRRDQPLVRFCSDSGDESHTITSQVPGLVRVHTASQRHLSHGMRIGTLEYGEAFERILSLRKTNAETAKKNALDRHQKAKHRYARQRLELQRILQTLRRDRAALRKRQTANDRIAHNVASLTSGAIDKDLPLSLFLPSLLRSLTGLAADDPIGSETLIGLCYLDGLFEDFLRLYGRYASKQTLPADQLLQAERSATKKLYAWYKARLAKNAQGLPDAIAHETLWLWDQLADTHLALMKEHEVINPYVLECLP